MGNSEQLNNQLQCEKCGSKNICFGRNKTTVDVNAEGNYRQIVFNYCKGCGHGINVKFFD